MDEAIAMLRTTRPTFYRWLKTGKLKGMKVGRQWRFYKEDLDRFLAGEAIRYDLPTDIAPLIAALAKQAGGKPPSVASLSDPERIALAVDMIVKAAIGVKASDVHLDWVNDTGRLRFRIAGVLHVVAEFDARLLPSLIAQVKRFTGVCNVDIRDLPQDARIAHHEAGQFYAIRIAFLPALGGETMNMRIMPRDIAVGGLDWLGLDRVSRSRLERGLAVRSGMVVVSGPTGSGKTTALYSAIKHVATPANKVLSIEDPIESTLPGVVQVPVTGSMPFSALLKAALRADANVIVIGELRDQATVSLGLKAAMTGHLVLSGMHALDSARALRRMVEMGATRYEVAEGVRLVTSQRLVRKLCPECSVKDSPPAELLAWAAKAATEGGLNWQAMPRQFKKEVGCPKCSMTGFKGRLPAFEALDVTPGIAKLIQDGAAEDEIRALAVKQGMVTVAADAIRRACAGETSLAEAMRETGEV
jgi:excisionase family DNA binding protein